MITIFNKGKTKEKIFNKNIKHSIAIDIIKENTNSLVFEKKKVLVVRFHSINIFSGEQYDGTRKKQLTSMMRDDSKFIVQMYLKSFKYYNNENCISLNISCDEDIKEIFVEDFVKGYPILHIPFDLESYVKVQTCDKNKFWLNVIYDSIKYVINIWKWEQTFFDDVYNKCITQLADKA